MTEPQSLRFGIDIGGTFTDVILQVGSEKVYSAKVLSTPAYYGKALIQGIEILLQESDLKGADIAQIVHATTVVTNAVFERRGAKVALLTTAGFRDVLELGRMRVPALYNLMWDKPRPLVPRQFRREIVERVGAKGEVIQPLDVVQARATIRSLGAAGAESIAICLLHSYRNSVHEQQLANLVADELPGVPVSVSSQLTPDIGEYERTSTTVINAYAQPLVRSYLERISKDLKSINVASPMRLMQSNGDSIGVQGAIERPVNLVESGGAAGVIAARHVARRLGYQDCLVFDMGGTSTKATLVEGGELTRLTQFEIGSEISMGSRMTGGGGYPLLAPAVDVAEVGAGGGSIAWIDAGGGLKVGPRSAGASPGPACYGFGGENPTVTDANVALGYLPDTLAGGTLTLAREKATAAIESRIAKPLGLDCLEAALGIRSIAISTMVRAARAVSVQRGHDVRHFTMIAFGGSAPLHAMDVALALGMTRVIVPRLAGLLSATGLLVGDHGREFVRAIVQPTSALELDNLNAIVSDLERDARENLESEGTAPSAIQLTRSVIVRYSGQRSDLTIPMPKGVINASVLRAIESEFENAHEKAFGHHSPDDQIVIMKLIIRAFAVEKAVLKRMPAIQTSGAGHQQRKAYFGNGVGSIPIPVLSRTEVGPQGCKGPAVIEDDDCTTLVPSGCRLMVDQEHNLIIEATPNGLRP